MTLVLLCQEPIQRVFWSMCNLHIINLYSLSDPLDSFIYCLPRKFHHFNLFFLRFYLFISRERGWEGENHQCCLSCAPHQGPGPQPRHVPWLGIKSVTFWFTGWHSIHWATPARAQLLLSRWSLASVFSQTMEQAVGTLLV